MRLSLTPALRRARRWPLASVLAVSVACLAGFGLLAVAVVESWSAVLDVDARVNADVFGWSLRHDLAVTLARGLSVLGLSAVVIPTTAVLVVVLLVRREQLVAAWLALEVLGGWELVSLTKRLVDRPRPATDGVLWSASGASFPSGHAAVGAYGFAAFAVVVLLAAPLRWRWLAVTLAVLGPGVAASRVVLGVHWLSDVVAGYLLGLGWLAAATGLLVGLARRATPADQVSPSAPAS